MERFVVLGHAHVRSQWFHELARWSTAAAIPIELVKTMSMDEVRARLRGGRAYSALIVDDGVAGLDRELLAEAADAGVPVVVVDVGRGWGRWLGLGAATGLPSDFSQHDLMQALRAVATPLPTVERALPRDVIEEVDAIRCPLLTVTGPRGAGRSTVAMALAQGVASMSATESGVCLADLALHADLAMLHDATNVVPSAVELIDAHRFGTVEPQAVRDLTWSVPVRGYRLLLGLRHHREWTTLRPRSVAAAITSLRGAFSMVVADVDGDLEGERATGSVEVEERNTLSRAAIDAADLVIAVGLPTLQGTHALVRAVRELLDHGVGPDRILVVVNRAPRHPRARAELVRAHEDLLGVETPRDALPSPVFLADRRNLDSMLRAGEPFPAPWLRSLTRSVLTTLDQATSSPEADQASHEPVRIVPGSLGTWSGR